MASARLSRVLPPARGVLTVAGTAEALAWGGAEVEEAGAAVDFTDAFWEGVDTGAGPPVLDRLAAPAGAAGLAAGFAVGLAAGRGVAAAGVLDLVGGLAPTATPSFVPTSSSRSSVR